MSPGTLPRELAKGVGSEGHRRRAGGPGMITKCTRRAGEAAARVAK